MLLLQRRRGGAAESASQASDPGLLDRFLLEFAFILAGAVSLAALFGAAWMVTGIALAAVCVLFAMAHGRRALFVERDQLVTTIAALKTQIQTRSDDPDTGLGTLPDLQIWWAVAVARTRRHGEPFSLVLLEVARGFRANTPLSRAEAAAVAERIRSSKRADDALFRLDTWTFAVLLSGSGQAGASAFIERIRARVASRPVNDSHVSISARAAAWHEGYGSLVEHLHAADEGSDSTQAADPGDARRTVQPGRGI